MLKLFTSNLTSLLTFTSIVLSFFILKENFDKKSQEDFLVENQNQEVQNTSLSCSQTSAWESAIKQNPSLKKQHTEWEAKMLQAQSNKNIHSNIQPSSVPYELPVVVHIIHDNGGENISDALVQTGISDLNDAFANQGYYDKGIGTDTQISFCLATQDPDGNLTTGINRVQSPLTEMNEPVNDLDVKNLIRWNPLNYINIWVVKEICSGQECATAGYAFFPSAHGLDIDGIVMESLYFGTTKSNSSVLVHEMGHYLGLYHTFQGGCNNNDCLSNGDRVCDTPPDQTSVPSPCNAAFNSCTTDVNLADPNNPFTTDQNDQTSNFMDYGYFQCFHSLTSGQAVRMQNAISTARSSLLNSPGCQSACPTLITSSFDVPNAPINLGSTITFNNTSTGGLYFDWTIDQVPFDGTYTFDTEGTYEITLVVTNDDPNCLASSTAVVTVICEAQAALTVDTTQTQINSIINFTDNSTNATNISWTVDGNVVNNTPNFQFSSPSVGNFTVCLIASNSICQSEVCQLISIVGNNSVLEICDNGFDDDGDGLIDCYDPDCCNTGPCVDNYYQDCVDVTDCDTTTINYDFTIALEWSTPLTTKKAPILNVIGDINNDGIPNILQGRRVTNKLDMLNGSDGSVVWTIDLEDAGNFSGSTLIADVDHDGTAEIFMTIPDKIFRVEHDGTISAEGALPSNGGGWFKNYFITDFNEDGTPEIMHLNNIIDVTTLQVIATLPLTDYSVPYEYGTGVPLDVFPASPSCPDCDGLELVLGPFLFSLNPTTFEFTKIHGVAINDPFYSNQSTTAIADMDNDGDLDAVIEADEINTLYVWDIQTPTIMAKETDGVFPFSTTSHNRPAVADLDGDGLPEIICRNANDLVAYNGDLLTIDWTTPIQEFGGNATQSVFDVNGDGLPEVIYRDNAFLRIINGQTGELLSSIPCQSGTGSELPVIADIDADGEAEIFCECNARAHVFGRGGSEPWANARKVWNQKQYYNTNINDDLTVPVIQQQVNLVGDGNIMNSFYQQTVVPREPVDCEEICDNGIDDDGDGLIDCFDPDCCESVTCVDNYYTDCVVENCDTSTFTDFSIQLEWGTPSNLSVLPFLHVIGDIDNDGTPNFLQGTNNPPSISLWNGDDGSVEWGAFPNSPDGLGVPLIADVDKDGTAEIFLLGTNTTRIEHDGTISVEGTIPNSASGSWWYHYLIADFNQDGKPELMYANHILDVETLEIIASLPFSNNYTYWYQFGIGVAVDVLPASPYCPDCDGLELVVGPYLYSLDPVTFEFTQVHAVPINDPFFEDSHTTSIADLDKDGDLDALVSGYGNTTFVWDIQTPTIMFKESDGILGVNGGHNYPAIADLDLDGIPEIILRVGGDLVAYNNDFSSIDWSTPIQEFGGNATQSVFDIDGNGYPEIIYRDNAFLRIIDGQTGMLLSSIECVSGTSGEIPVIADVDGDGEAEIFCECSNKASFFGGAGNKPWANTRKVWHQFSYFNVNINDDLTVPQVQQQQHLVGNGSIMNSFFQQTVVPNEPVDCGEICDNGIDDDGDGLIDCADDDCCLDNACNNQPTPCDSPCVFVGNVDLGPDVQVCDNGIFNFDAGVGFSSYLWSDQSSDQTFTATGIGTIWVIAMDSCGNSYTDSVTISLVPQTDVNLGADISLCSGDSTIISGGTFDTYQWYKDDVLVCDGCNEIMVTPVVPEEYVLLAGTSQGCFSIDTINIFLDTIAVGYETRFVCDGDTIDVFGQPVFDNQVLEFQIGAQGVCDSIINVTVELKEDKISNQIINICEGDTVNVFGENISTSTILQQDNTTTFGCDSIQIVEVVVADIIEQSDSYALCNGDSVIILNQTIFSDTTIVESLNTVNGCDSIHTYFISFNNVIQTQENVTVCEGDTIQIFGQPIFEETTLSQTFTSTNNCDSTHTVNVLLLNDTLTTETINLCQGDSITINGFTYTINSLILRPSTAENGCDSTHIIDIVIINTFEASDSIIICEGDSVIIGNQNIYSDTTFTESINGPNSCDTIRTYYISTIPSVETQEEILLCEGDTVLVFGQPIFEQNTISQTFIGSNTCDSIHTVDVLLLNNLETNETINLCVGDSITIENTTYYQDAFFIQNFTASNGCDSLHSITIDFEYAIYLLDTTLLCEDEFVIFFGDTIANAGFFEFTQNPLGEGCDTINQLWVEVYDNPEATTFIDPACLEENNGQIEISNPQANWMYSLDGINYQTESIFDMLPSGNYQLWVENEYGCMSSSIFEIPNSILPDFTLQPEITIPSGLALEMPVTYSDTNNLQFNWSPGIGLSCTNCAYPSLTGITSQTYTLEVTDIFGCSISQLIDVNIAIEGIYIPNAFTPNNDGNNDRFTVFAGPSTPSIELLQIFDKWGEVLYELEDFAPNDESLGWDGTLRGQPMMTGIYVYKCIVMTPDDGLQTFTGDITLYR